MTKPSPQHTQDIKENTGTSGHKLLPCRIFLVEDDYDDRMLSKKKLEASDRIAEVVCFTNGDELIDYMQRQGFQDHSVMCLTPTLILLDLNMPKMDGFEVLKQLKSDHFLQEIPIVVISGNASYENVKRAHELKADGFFRKPLNVQKIQMFFDRGWQWPMQEMWMH